MDIIVQIQNHFILLSCIKLYNIRTPDIDSEEHALGKCGKETGVYKLADKYCKTDCGSPVLEIRK
jgi:hypothetical protein